MGIGRDGSGRWKIILMQLLKVDAVTGRGSDVIGRGFEVAGR